MFCSRFWSAVKRKKDLIVGIFAGILFIGTVFCCQNIINEPNVAVYERTFVEWNRDSPSVTCMIYWFSDEEDSKSKFHFDVFSKKKIYPKDLDKDMKYRIYYEEKTEIIVKVEELD